MTVSAMSRKTMYFPHSFLVFAVLLLILVVAVGLIFIGVVGLAFRDVGFSLTTTVLILVGTLVGSLVNIPLFKLKSTVPMIREESASFFGVTYRIPRVEYGCTVTTLALNVGGGLIPTAVSLYLLWKAPLVFWYCLLGLFLVAVITRAVARPVKGVGIVTPALVPPIAAALIAFLLPSGAPKIVAYVSGTLGTLIGADLYLIFALSRNWGHLLPA